MYEDSAWSSKSCDCNRVLVADDNDFNLFTFKEILKSFDIEAEGAVNGLDAFE